MRRMAMRDALILNVGFVLCRRVILCIMFVGSLAVTDVNDYSLAGFVGEEAL
jgi:hypothetical protein